MAQIDQKYDDLKPEQKQQFDQQAESFLAQDMSKMVIVYITYETNQPTVYLELANDLKSTTTEMLKNRVYLYGSKGDKSTSGAICRTTRRPAIIPIHLSPPVSG